MTEIDSAAFRAGSAGHLANWAARLFAAALADALRPMGVAPAQFMTLLELWSEEGQTQADLVARLDVEQATMAATLARMERDGLIERRPHPGDRRARQLWLTPHARTLKEPAIDAAQAINAAALAALSADERAQLATMLRRVVDALRGLRAGPAEAGLAPPPSGA
jgi:DNA-binding MarR family transcriptional regulator